MNAKHGALSRRAILKRAGASMAIVPCTVLGGRGAPTAPSTKLTLGVIGAGSMGLRHIEGFLAEDDCRVLAIADVDRTRLRAAADKVNRFYRNEDCGTCADFRPLIDRKDIDALVISVPDHWHALTAIAGIRAGKDIYGEKPLALTIDEGKAIVDAVERHRCVWQTGSWQRSTDHFRFACELVRNGRIGKLQRVEVGIGVGPTCDPQPQMPVPEGFDYDLWLGPAPAAPYTEKRCHWNFRWILDYAGGQVTDWGTHHVDIAHWGMDADGAGPVRIEGSGDFPDSLWNAAVTYRFTCTYAGGVTMTVASNNFLPQGVRWIGDAGWVHVTREGLKTQPEALQKTPIGPDEIHLPRPPGDHRRGHRRDFIKCVASRGTPITPVRIGHSSATVCHLGNIAMVLGRPIRWDPVRQDIVGDETAREAMRRPMRAPWRL